MKIKTKKEVLLCEYCIQGIKSHGEKLTATDETTDEEQFCEFCGEADILRKCFF